VHQRAHSDGDAKRRKVAASSLHKKRKAPRAPIQMIRAAPLAKQASNASSETRRRLPAESRESASQIAVSVRVRRLTNKMDAVCADLGPLSFKQENDAAVAGVIERPSAQIRYVAPIPEQTRTVSLLRWAHEISMLARRRQITGMRELPSRRVTFPQPRLRM
jgi:hypothetical protein